MRTTHPQLLRILGFLLIAGLTLNANGQKAKYKLAENYFLTFDFKQAAEVYEDILQKNPEDTIALRQAAVCYHNLGKTVKQEEKLAVMAKLPSKKSSDLLAYAQALRANRKYAESMKVYEEFAKMDPENPIAVQYLEDPQIFNKMLRDSTRYTVKASAVNSENSDFGVCLLDSGEVIFASARPEGKGKGREYNWNHQSYLNLYKTTLKADSTLEGAKVAGNDLNTRFHEGAVGYDKLNKKLYITRNIVKGSNTDPDETGVLRLGIYSVDFENGDWENLTPFHYNNTEYSVGQPSFSADGQRMYFVSDMPGGFGGTDIWYCDRSIDGWATPVNMGFKVNTSGDEFFPYTVGDRFFFSSDGQAGIGGLDNFYAVMDGPSILSVVNLGYPANTSSDDFGIVMFEGTRRGFFSSNRPGGMGDDDIYELVISPPTKLIISGTIVDDATNEPIDGATILLSELLGQEQDELLGNSGENGLFNIEVPFADQLKIRTVKQLYFPAEVELKPDALSGYIENVVIRMKRFDYAVEGKVYLAETNKVTSGATVRLLDKQGNVVEEIVTAADGRYFFILEEGMEYEVEASYPDHLTLSEEISTINQPKGIRYIDFTLFKPQKGVVVKVNNIYYDYNKATIRPDAAKELDRLVKILVDNPTMKIELGSHSDSRGSDSYNMALSERRAKAVVDYLISKGIDKKRLISKGYGETQLKNHCKNDVECTDAEHEENRRTEFKILDI